MDGMELGQWPFCIEPAQPGIKAQREMTGLLESLERLC